MKWPTLIITQEYLHQIREALARVPQGGWREFAAFAGPEMDTLVAWNSKIVLVGGSSHALSGAFGSGAGFAMEDGWILAQSLAHFDTKIPHIDRKQGSATIQALARDHRRFMQKA